MVDLAGGEGIRAEMAQAELDKRPPLTASETIVWEGFGILSTERQTSMTFGAIPFRAMVAYTSFYCMTHSEAQRFVSQVLALDRVLVDAKNREAARSSK